MLLQSLLEGSLQAKLCIFQEKSHVKVVPFLKAAIKDENLRYGSLHFICFKKPPDYYTDTFPAKHKVNFYDGFSDPVAWNSEPQEEQRFTRVHVNSNFHNTIAEKSKKVDGSTEKVIIVFDDLSLLCRHKSASDVCRMVTTLATETLLFEAERIIIFLQSDLLSTMTVNAFRYIADAYVSIDQKLDHKIRQGSNRSAAYEVDVMIKKKSGKIIREAGLHSFSSTNTLTKLKDISLSNDEAEETEGSDPTANLPFNLKLSDSERAARSEVRLPYMFDTEQKAAQLGKRGGGKIIYQPDDGDDFDEEDPDDDLDI